MRNPAQPPETVPVILNDAAPKGELIPYAFYGGNTRDSVSGRLSRLTDETIEFMPDAFLYTEGQAQQAGSVSQYIGFGISTNSPVMVLPCGVWLTREAPSVLALKLNQANMVVGIRDPSMVTGIQEGDTVLSVDDVTLETDGHAAARSPALALRLRLKPGDTVKVIAIRPGTGKVSGEAKAMPNPREYLQIPGIPDLARVSVTVSAGGSPHWRTR
jgi:hypothetical protein